MLGIRILIRLVPDLLRSLQPDPSALQSNCNPICSKSTGFENTDIQMSNSTDRIFETADFYTEKRVREP
jgi:hypothetical protein